MHLSMKQIDSLGWRSNDSSDSFDRRSPSAPSSGSLVEGAQMAQRSSFCTNISVDSSPENLPRSLRKSQRHRARLFGDLSLKRL